jgi:hypothetical protein
MAAGEVGVTDDDDEGLSVNPRLRVTVGVTDGLGSAVGVDDAIASAQHDTHRYNRRREAPGCAIHAGVECSRDARQRCS